MNVTDLKPGFHQFGNKGAVWNNATHIVKNGFGSTTLCGTPMLSTNWAEEEGHKTIGCEKCLEVYKTLLEGEEMDAIKKDVLERIDYMNTKQITLLRDLLQTVSFGMCSKGALMKLLYGEHYTGIDSALPQGWVNEMRELYPTFNTSAHCMNYKDHHHGQVENIMEEIMYKLCNTFSV